MKTKYKYLYAEANYGQEEINSVIDTLNNQRYSLMGGKKTKDLEIKVSKIFGMKYGLMTNYGYGTKAHIDAIRENGYTDYHRKTFKIKSLQN